jgi:hypothetical protein
LLLLQLAFTRRKACLLNKAYELHAVSGADILLVVASEVGSVYTFTSARLAAFMADENSACPPPRGR